jgi:6-pyruvoyltetrahydropterin/6-carboxytetrahydropterin synthase
MISVTRKYDFAASHRLHSAALSEDDNRRIFGKCNNPFGHGHNYEISVTARGPVDAATGLAVDARRLDRLVEAEVLAPFDHKNMNAEVAAFAETVPTTENLAIEIARRLREKWAGHFPGPWPVFEKLSIRETDRNIFELTGFNGEV